VTDTLHRCILCEEPLADIAEPAHEAAPDHRTQHAAAVFGRKGCPAGAVGSGCQQGRILRSALAQIRSASPAGRHRRDHHHAGAAVTQSSLRHWLSIVEMRPDHLVTGMCMLRSGSTNPRRHLDRYRSIVTGVGGALATFNALFNSPKKTESKP
jgi:hypothetical protein